VDLSAAFLDAILVFLGIIMADVTWKIGLKTGFLQYWRLVTAGFVVIAVSRIILVIAELDDLWPNAEWKLKDLGLAGVILATLLMLLGAKGLLQAVERAAKHAG
jgi:hypothetical protein